jgi:cellulose synthase/poly-beta-1,6-N-acetylglucosamine synthase-like glycosyltransferase
VIVVDCCCMCNRNEKSVNLLIHCEVACSLWNSFFIHFVLSHIMPSQVVDLFAGGSSQSVVV